jgi:hypothetical protein
MVLRRVLDTDFGSVLISIIIGLGLAAAFRQVCTDSKCVVIKGPPVSEVQDTRYRIGDKCYRYTPYVVPCRGPSSSAPPPGQPM